MPRPTQSMRTASRNVSATPHTACLLHSLLHLMHLLCGILVARFVTGEWTRERSEDHGFRDSTADKDTRANLFGLSQGRCPRTLESHFSQKRGDRKKKSREKQKGKERKGKKEEKKRERMNQRKKKRSDTREHLLTNLHYSFPPGTLRVAMRSSEALVHPQIGGTYWLGFRQGQRVRRRNSRQQLCSPLQKHVSRGVA